MVPPRNVNLEVGDQLLRSRKGIGTFLSTEMPMIALPKFVVVAQNAFPMADIGVVAVLLIAYLVRGLGAQEITLLLRHYCPIGWV